MVTFTYLYNYVTWGWWRLRSAAVRLFVQCLFRLTPKEIATVSITGTCERNPPVAVGFPSQRASNAESVLISLYRHALWLPGKCLFFTWSWPTIDDIFLCERKWEYRQVSNIRRTKSKHSQDSRTFLRLSLPNPLKPDVKSRMTI